jgi:hypothetical protein
MSREHTMTETEKLKAALVEALLDAGFKNDPGCLSGIPGQEHFVLMPDAAEQIAEAALTAWNTRPSVVEGCSACYRGEVFGLSTDDGFWVEMGASAGGAHAHGMNGWLELIEHHPDGTEKRREYVATDSRRACDLGTGRLVTSKGPHTMTETEKLIADIEAEMEGRERGFADKRGELLFRCSDALATAASRIEELERALKVADHDLTTTHNLRATDLSPDQMNEALNRGVALSDLEWMTDNSRGLEAARQALSDKG